MNMNDLQYTAKIFFNEAKYLKKSVSLRKKFNGMAQENLSGLV